MKRLLAFALALCIAFSLLPATASAASADIVSGKCGADLTWTLNKSTGVLTISGTGQMDHTYGTRYAPWDEFADLIVEIEIEQGVESIGKGMCSGLPNLERVSIPDSVNTIHDRAFAGCSKLEEAYLPDSVTYVGVRAFNNCTALREINLPYKASFEQNAFGNCTSLTEIYIPVPDVSFDISIFPVYDEAVFIGCTALETVIIEEGVTALGMSMFSGCTALTEITLPDSLTAIPAFCFNGCSSLSKVTLGNKIEKIGREAFQDCTSLTTLTIPASVTKIQERILNDCSSMREVYFMGSAPEIDTYAFSNVSFVGFYPPDDPTWNSETMLQYGSRRRIVWVPHGHVHEYTTSGRESTCIIDGYTAYTCAGCGYTYVEKYGVLPHNYVEGVCTGCGRLDPEWDGSAASSRWGGNITWKLTQDGTLILSGEGTVARVDSAADYPWYAYAEQVKKVIFEEGITNVPEYALAFSYPNLVSVELKSVEIIDYTTFTMCEALTEVILPDTLKEIRASAFATTALEEIQIPGGVTLIGSNAFIETKLQEIVLPEGLLELGDGVFMGCAELKSAYLPDSVTYIGMHLFGYCTALETANIPSGLEYMPDMMFDGCSSLKEIVIPEGVSIIGMTNFRGTALTTVTIPASVTAVVSAFMDCMELTEIIFEGDAPEIGPFCFENVTATALYPAGNETWTEEVMQNYGGNITWVPYGEAEEETLVKWYSGTTSLNGTIDLNIYVLLSENLVNADDTYVRFTYADRVVDVPMADALHSPNEGNPNRYRFSCPIYAKQLADSVNVKFMKGEEMIGTELNYSVKQYCENQIKKSPDEKLVALCKALLNYGAAAQQLLNYNTENLANASLSEEDKILHDVDASDYKYSVTGSEDGIKAKSATLMLEDVVKVRVYFTLTGDKSIDEYTITIDGKAVTPSYNEKGWYVETDGIPGKDLEKMFQVQVGGITVNYGALSFVNSKVGGSDVLESNISKALYAYWQAAEALLG